MDINKIIRRYKELEDEISKHILLSAGSAFLVNGNKDLEPSFAKDVLWNWIVKALNLVGRTCGESSQHFKMLEKTSKDLEDHLAIKSVSKLLPIFSAARSDFEGGFIFEIKEMVRAEIFDDELEQAEELLKNNFILPAAIVAGIVLETNLRFLCEKNEIPVGKLDKMNSDLAAKSVYSKNTQKQITAIAGIRNSAAHGVKDDLTLDRVGLMINEVRNITESLGVQKI